LDFDFFLVLLEEGVDPPLVMPEEDGEGAWIGDGLEGSMLEVFMDPLLLLKDTALKEVTAVWSGGARMKVDEGPPPNNGGATTVAPVVTVVVVEEIELDDEETGKIF